MGQTRLAKHTHIYINNTFKTIEVRLPGKTLVMLLTKSFDFPKK